MKCHVLAAACLLAVFAAVYADESQFTGSAPRQVQQFQRPLSQPARPVPYPLRRQSNGLVRARLAFSDFMDRVMSAGRRFRRMASTRLFSMFNRRSLRRSQRVRGRAPFRRQ